MKGHTMAYLDSNCTFGFSLWFGFNVLHLKTTASDEDKQLRLKNKSIELHYKQIIIC